MEEVIIAAKESNIQYINKFELTGSVVHKFRPRPDIMILTVAVKGRSVHDADYPNVAFYGEAQADAIDRNVIVEDRNYPRVRITGTIQTSRRETDEGARSFQNFVGKSIVRTQTAMEQLTGMRGLGSRKAESTNDVCLMGVVTNVRRITRADSDRVIGVSVTIRTNLDGHANFPRVTCFNGSVPAALELERGDAVCAVGFIETSTREREGERIKLESVIATEIVKIDPAASE